MANQMMQDKASEMAATQTVPTGYKQTEVGVIPEDWECKHIGELADVVRGGSPRPAGDARFFNGNFIPWLTVASLTNISLEQMYVVDTATKLTELGSLRSRVLNEDTLIISNSGATLGVAKILKIKCCANDGVAALVNQRLGNKVFLAHYINTQTKKLQEKIATGNGQPNLNTDLIRVIPVPFPREAEQAAIANVLSDTDALIAGLEQLIAKKQAIKTASMQQLLTGRTRLPQFARGPDGAPKSYKSSELGQIPEDWDVVCAGDLGKFRGGNGFPVIEQGKLNGEYPFYKVSDMNNEGNDVYMSASNNWISKEDQSRIGSFVFPSGCIVFAKVGAAVFLERKKILSMPSCIDNNMAAFELNIAKCDVNFVYHFLQSIRFGDFVSTTALPSLNASVLSKIKIIMPLIKEQTAIATILYDMDNELQALTQKLEKARALKQGMMQQLLTGRIRLPLPQEA